MIPQRRPLILFEADERERRAERRAATGDPQAMAHYRRQIQRRGGTDEHLRGYADAWRRNNTRETRTAYKKELEAFGREIPRELKHAHVPRVSRETAEGFTHGHTFHHHSATNADGSPARCRVTGRVKTWRTRPDEFRIPVKHGMRNSFYITHDNAHEWMVGHPDEHPEDDS
jgi:hypothetical protein